MSHDVFGIIRSGTETGLRVFVEKLGTDVSSVFTQELVVESWLTVFNVSEKLFFIFIIKWWLSAKHFIDDSSKGPPVRCLTMALSLQDFWSKVFSSSANTLGLVVSNDIFF